MYVEGSSVLDTGGMVEGLMIECGGRSVEQSNPLSSSSANIGRYGGLHSQWNPCGNEK